MKAPIRTLLGLIVLVSVTFLCTAASAQGTMTDSKRIPGRLMTDSTRAHSTLDNLQTCYYTESYEHRLYSRFADRADSQGYGQVASMFRAISRAEQIHADSKAALIGEMGATPQESSDPITVGTTRENLEFALASETYENNVMYADAIKLAHKEKNQAAAQAFAFATAAEPTHVAMFRQALDDMDGYRGENIDFYVCPVCGTTVRALHGSRCPVCSTPMERFERIR
jgi:rubrerythrin